MEHREEREFRITIHLSAAFAADYDGDEDGFAWHEHFERELKPELVRAVFSVLRSDPRWAVRAAPRGRNPEETLELEAEFRPVR
ncbi:MAG: hypothetical protein U0263_12850 [Polyangiaceae bacterium]